MALTDSGSGRVIVDGGRSKAWTAEHQRREAPANEADSLYDRYEVTVAEDVAKGDLLGVSGGTWVRAHGDTATLVQPRVVALDDAANGAQCPVSPDAVVTGYTGGTLGAPVYVSAAASEEGRVTETAGAPASGDSDVPIGFVLDATTVVFRVGTSADSVG